MSAVRKNGVLNHRPAWLYRTGGDDEDAASPVALLQMMESVRNAVEQVRDELRGIRTCPLVAEGFVNLRKISTNTSRIPARRKVAKRG